MSDRALTYVADCSGTNGDAEVRKSTLWTPYWESKGSVFLRLGFMGVWPISVCTSLSATGGLIPSCLRAGAGSQSNRRLRSLRRRPYSDLGHAYFSPIRGVVSAAGVVSGPGDGLHGSERGDEHRRARLLPRDEEAVRADGQHAWVAWLLPKDCIWRSR